MKRLGLLVCFCTALVFAAPRPHQNTSTPDASSHGSKQTIEGLVRDIACPIENPAASATVFNLKCAQDCAKNGSPLIILTSKGEIYTPISGSMPDKDQRQRLVPFVGKYVQATGTVYERSGTRAIAINEIHERKDVHLTTDAQ
ncbi:MAG: hypothetical protein WB780_16135 [Candidatus Acidiferrales bacterium]